MSSESCANASRDTKTDRVTASYIAIYVLLGI